MSGDQTLTRFSKLTDELLKQMAAFNEVRAVATSCGRGRAHPV
jgi:hypothetical protein